MSSSEYPRSRLGVVGVDLDISSHLFDEEISLLPYLAFTFCSTLGWCLVPRWLSSGRSGRSMDISNGCRYSYSHEREYLSYRVLPAVACVFSSMVRDSGGQSDEDPDVSLAVLAETDPQRGRVRGHGLAVGGMACMHITAISAAKPRKSHPGRGGSHCCSLATCNMDATIRCVHWCLPC